MDPNQSAAIKAKAQVCSRIVPITQIAAHPDNPNRVPERTMKLIARHIRENGQNLDHAYPPLIVRSLEVSDRFTAEHDKGLLQLLDGEHRLKILADLGNTEVRVDVWPGISDTRAMMLLATLNQRGRDDAQLRADLISKIVHDMDEDVAHVATYLPESEEDIKKYMEITPTERSKAGMSDPDKPRETTRMGVRGSGHVNLQVFLANSEMRKEINDSVAKLLDQIDPSCLIPFRDGEALHRLVKAGAKALLG